MIQDGTKHLCKITVFKRSVVTFNKSCICLTCKYSWKVLTFCYLHCNVFFSITNKLLQHNQLTALRIGLRRAVS